MRRYSSYARFITHWENVSLLRVNLFVADER